MRDAVRDAVRDDMRDDLGLARQAGWIPARPGFMLRMIVARRRERQAMAMSPR